MLAAAMSHTWRRPAAFSIVAMTGISPHRLAEQLVQVLDLRRRHHLRHDDASNVVAYVGQRFQVGLKHAGLAHLVDADEKANLAIRLGQRAGCQLARGGLLSRGNRVFEVDHHNPRAAFACFPDSVRAVAGHEERGNCSPAPQGVSLCSTLFHICIIRRL